MRLGVVGAVAALLATLAGWVLVDGVVASLRDSLTLTDEAIVAIGDTIDVAEEALVATGGGLEAVRAAVADVGTAVDTTGSVLADADVVLGTTVPAGIDAIRRPLPGLIRSSEGLSSVLNGLSVFGVDFRPDPPPAVSLRSIDEELAELADRLRSPTASLGRVGDELGTVTDDLDAIVARLDELSGAVGRGEQVLRDYDLTTGRAAELVVAATHDLERRRTLARLLVVLVGAVVIGSQIALIVLGRHLRSGVDLLPTIGPE